METTAWHLTALSVKAVSKFRRKLGQEADFNTKKMTNLKKKGISGDFKLLPNKKL